MARWICLLLTGLMLVSGCSFTHGKFPFARDTKPRFAVVDWDKLVEQHPKYKEWQRQKEQLEAAKWLRDRQKENGQQQLDILGKMSAVKKAGAGQFQSAAWSAKVAEKRAQEQDALRKNGRPWKARRTKNSRRTPMRWRKNTASPCSTCG